MANRTREKTITVFHGVHGASPQAPPPAGEPGRRRREAAHRHANRDPGLLARRRSWRSCAPPTSEQDAAIFLTAAFTGLRQGELVALRWRDVDFPGSAIRVRASYTNGHLTSPKSGKVRSVPMAAKVAEALARLGQRELFTDEDDLVFAGIVGGYLDGSALSKRYRAALVRAGRRLRSSGQLGSYGGG